MTSTGQGPTSDGEPMVYRRVDSERLKERYHLVDRAIMSLEGMYDREVTAALDILFAVRAKYAALMREAAEELIGNGD